MDKFLSIDLSIVPAKAIVVTNENGRFSLLESIDLQTPSPDYFINKLHFPITNTSQQEEEATMSDVGEPDLSDLEQMLNRHRLDLLSSVVVLPAQSYLGIPLRLPLQESRQVGQVINLEIQDLIPFEIENFYLAYSALSPDSSGLLPVHASLFPKAGLDWLQQMLMTHQVPVNYYTVAAAVLPGDSLPTQPTVFFNQGFDQIYLTSVAEQKVIDIQSFPNPSKGSLPKTELKMFQNSCARMWPNQDFEFKIIGNHLNLEELKEIFDQPIESWQISDAPEAIDTQVAWQAAKLVAKNPDSLICNFQQANLAMNPWFRLAWNYICRMKIGFAYLALFLLLIPGAGYWWGQQEIFSLQDAIRQNITKRIPWVSFPEEKELDTLMQQSAAIEKQLESLGSPAKTEPIDVYFLLSEVLAEAVGPKVQMDLQEVNIQGNRVELSGTVPSYKGVDRLEKILKERKNIFCRVKAESPGGGTNKRFQFRITLC